MFGFAKQIANVISIFPYALFFLFHYFSFNTVYIIDYFISDLSAISRFRIKGV